MGKKLRSISARISIATVTCVGILMAASGSAQAEPDYPDRPIRIVVPFAAGGSTDLVARSMAEGLGKLWRKPVVVENREGASGTIGARVVANAKPDGYTLLFGTQTTVAVAPHILKTKPYDAEKDFIPITELVHTTQLLSVPKSSKFHSLKDFIAYAKAHPDELTYGGGYGATTDMSMRLLMSAANIDLLGVPYKGSALSMNDLLAGRLDAMFDVVTTSLPHVKAGNLRALATTSPKRLSTFPDVPTFAEEGYPNFPNVWFGLFAPAGTPSDIVQKIADDSRRVLNEPERKKILVAAPLSIVASSPEDFTKLVQDENKTWLKVVKDYNLKIQ